MHGIHRQNVKTCVEIEVEVHFQITKSVLNIEIQHRNIEILHVVEIEIKEKSNSIFRMDFVYGQRILNSIST